MPLDTDRNTQMQDAELIAVPMAAVKVFAGSLVAANASGYATPGAAAATLTYLGRAEETVDNSGGSAGDLTVLVRRGKAFKFGNYASDLVTQAELGKPCFIYDDYQVAKTSNNGARSVAGIVLGVESDGVWIGEAAPKSSALLAAVADFTDSTGAAGPADATLADGVTAAAPAEVTAYAAVVNMSEPVAKAEGEAVSAALKTLRDEVAALQIVIAALVTDVGVQNQNDSDIAAKVNALLAKLRTAGIITA